MKNILLVFMTYAKQKVREDSDLKQFRELWKRQWGLQEEFRDI